MTTTRTAPVTEAEIAAARDSVRLAIAAANIAVRHAAESASRIRSRGAK